MHMYDVGRESSQKLRKLRVGCAGPDRCDCSKHARKQAAGFQLIVAAFIAERLMSMPFEQQLLLSKDHVFPTWKVVVIVGSEYSHFDMTDFPIDQAICGRHREFDGRVSTVRT